MKNILDPIVKNIPEEDKKNPTIILLLELFEQQFEIISALKEENQILKDEIARLKNQKPKPKIRPTKLSKDTSRNSPEKISKPKKRKKTVELTIHKEERIAPVSIPAGSTFKGLKPYTVQDLCISACNTRYFLEQWQTPDGKIVAGKLPPEIDGHFGNTLKSFILYQYHHCHVTQPLILEQLHEWDMDISYCQVNRILIENKEQFHAEKDDILAAGLNSSAYINVDDTAARHDGKNGYCTHIGNEFFAYFVSTDSKSRINFLKLLRTGKFDYILNDNAFQYMIGKRLPKSPLTLLENHSVKKFTDDKQWQEHLENLGITTPRHVRIATEGSLLGSVLSQIPKDLFIVSDDAGQFNIHNHALCWIHAERTLAKLIGPSTVKQKTLEDVRKQVWEFYDELKSFTGRQCRDTFVSLKKTCRKLGISFWQYLKDRHSGKNLILPLSQLVEQKSNALR